MRNVDVTKISSSDYHYGVERLHFADKMITKKLEECKQMIEALKDIFPSKKIDPFINEYEQLLNNSRKENEIILNKRIQKYFVMCRNKLREQDRIFFQKLNIEIICWICGSTKGVSLHHLNYELERDIAYLCFDCHNKQHQYR